MRQSRTSAEALVTALPSCLPACLTALLDPLGRPRPGFRLSAFGSHTALSVRERVRDSLASTIFNCRQFKLCPCTLRPPTWFWCRPKSNANANAKEREEREEGAAPDALRAAEYRLSAVSARRENRERPLFRRVLIAVAGGTRPEQTTQFSKKMQVSTATHGK